MIPKGIAERLAGIIERHCGPISNGVAPFVAYVGRNESGEYRFIGSLGMGGKFWFDRYHWYINYYPEDKTPERDQAIIEANIDIVLVRQEVLTRWVSKAEMMLKRLERIIDSIYPHDNNGNRVEGDSSVSGADVIDGVVNLEAGLKELLTSVV